MSEVFLFIQVTIPSLTNDTESTLMIWQDMSNLIIHKN